jgi:hypothetical protein
MVEMMSPRGAAQVMFLYIGGDLDFHIVTLALILSFTYQFCGEGQSDHHIEHSIGFYSPEISRSALLVRNHFAITDVKVFQITQRSLVAVATRAGGFPNNRWRMDSTD